MRLADVEQFAGALIGGLDAAFGDHQQGFGDGFDHFGDCRLVLCRRYGAFRGSGRLVVAAGGDQHRGRSTDQNHQTRLRIAVQQHAGDRGDGRDDERQRCSDPEQGMHMSRSRHGFTIAKAMRAHDKASWQTKAPDPSLRAAAH